MISLQNTMCINRTECGEYHKTKGQQLFTFLKYNEFRILPAGLD